MIHSATKSSILWIALYFCSLAILGASAPARSEKEVSGSQRVAQICRQALDLTRTIEVVPDRIRLLVEVALAHLDAGDGGTARRILQEAIELGDSRKPGPDQVAAFCLVAPALHKANDLDASRRLLDKLLSSGPAQQSFNRHAVSKILVKVGDYDGAANAAIALDGARSPTVTETAALIAGASNKETRPDARRAITKLATALAAAGDFAAINFAPGMAKAQAEVGDVDGAWKTVKLLDGLNAAARLGRVVLAKANARAGIATGQARSGDIEGARKTLAAISEDEAKLDALYAIAGAQVKVGQRAAARATMQEAGPLADGIRKKYEALPIVPGRKSPFIIFLAKLAIAQANTGDFVAATNTAMATSATTVTRTHLLIKIVEAQMQAHEVAGARRSLRQASLAALQIEANLTKAIQLRTVAEMQADAGDPTEALRTARLIDDDISRAFALSKAVSALATTGKLAEARKAADEIGQELPKAQALSEIACAQAAGGDYVGALRWANALTSPRLRVMALCGIAKGLTKRAKKGHSE
jgi:tetratricopeptide (TPR) repeat protein